MDKSNLTVSSRKREMEVITPHEVTVSNEKSEKSVIRLKNGSEIILEPEHISDIIRSGARIIEGIISISTIREQGTQAVNQIRAEIEKIYASSRAEVHKIEAESKSWNKKFDEKKELLFDVIHKIENNSGWSDEIKKTIILAVVAVINEKD